MNTSIEFHEAFNPTGAPMPILSACVRVVFEGYDAWTFKGYMRPAYQDACRFERLVSLGYEPATAYHLALNGDEATLLFFAGHFDMPSHSEEARERGALPIKPELDSSLVSDWLTEAYIEEYGLEDGDEVSLPDIAHFFAMNYSKDVPPPAWLMPYIQEQDELSFEEAAAFIPTNETDDYPGISHHIGYIPY